MPPPITELTTDVMVPLSTAQLGNGVNYVTLSNIHVGILDILGGICLDTVTQDNVTVDVLPTYIDLDGGQL